MATQYVQYPNSASASVSANQGTPNTLANAWPVIPTDGTNSQVFTAAGEAEVSVTQPLPAGSNAIGSVIVSNLPVTQPVSGSVTVTQAIGTNLHTVVDSGSVTVSGTVTADAGIGTFTVGQATGTNLHTVVDSGSVTVSGTVAATQSGTWTVQPGNTANTTAWKVDGSAVTQPVSGTVTANAGTGNFTVTQATGTNLHTVVDSGTVAATQSGTWNINNVSGTVSLPTGAATSAKQPALGTAGSASADVITVQGITSMTALKVDGSAVTQPVSGTVSTTVPGKTSVAILRNDYSSVNVTTAAYVQLLASTTGTINRLDIFDSSGQTLVFAVGGAGSEVNQFNIYPGGNGRIDLTIASGSRLSVKAVSATASAGELDINCFS